MTVEKVIEELQKHAPSKEAVAGLVDTTTDKGYDLEIVDIDAVTIENKEIVMLFIGNIAS